MPSRRPVALVHRARRAGGVLDDGDAPRLAERPDGVQVGRHPGLIRHDDRPGAAGQAGRDRVRDKVQRGRVHVGENGSAPT